jgi:sarcosine oxidase subunit delta
MNAAGARAARATAVGHTKSLWRACHRRSLAHDRHLLAAIGYQESSTIARPPPGCSDEAWARYLFFRSNPKGEHAERWCHSFGCGQWFNALRDTTTHEIIATWRMGEPRPS